MLSARETVMPMLAARRYVLPFTSSGVAISSQQSTRDALPELLRVLVDAGDEEHELVPAESRHQVVRTDGAAQPVGDLHEHRVADGVPGRVVDVLEVVQVAEEQDDPAGVLTAGVQPVPQPLHQQRAVRPAT